MRSYATSIRILAVSVAVGACATLGQLIQPPTFTASSNQQAQVRLLGPASGRPLGGIGVRLYARVQNPNAFGLTLTTLNGHLFLDGHRAAAVDLPLGLPMRAVQDTVLPIDLNISFADIPNLVTTLRNALTRNSMNYRVDGTFGVDAGPFGQPSFGPQSLFGGELQVLR